MSGDAGINRNSSPPKNAAKQESVKKEERLREKLLKRKLEDRKFKGSSTTTNTTNGHSSIQISALSPPDKDHKEREKKKEKYGGIAEDDTKVKTEGEGRNRDEKKLGRRARRGRNRRRRQKRQERNVRVNNLANSSSMVDNRSYYSQEQNFGRHPQGGGPHYRGGPGPYYQDHPRGGDTGRWERNGPQYDHNDSQGRNHGRHGEVGDYYNNFNNRDRNDRGISWNSRGGGGHPAENFSRGGGRPSEIFLRGRGRAPENFSRDGDRGGESFPPRGGGRSGGNFAPRGGTGKGSTVGSGGRGHMRSRSSSRSCSRSSKGSGSSYSDYSSSSSKGGYKRTRSRSHSSDASSAARSSSRSSSVRRSRSRSRSKSRSDEKVSEGEKKRRRSSSGCRSTDRQKSQDTEDKVEMKKTRMDDSSAEAMKQDDILTKDQRTVFVSQLVMRAVENDILKYFEKKCGCKVNDVILLRDRRTGRHKGCAYVELGRLVDVPRAVKFSGVVPNFQRFPILVKASEAEKNYTESHIAVTATNGALTGTCNPQGLPEKRVEAQKVYVGSIDRNITQAHLYAIFSQFGQLDKVLLQIDPTTGLSKGFAFLSFSDPKVANLAIQAMAGQVLAGRALARILFSRQRTSTHKSQYSLRTGWASMNTNTPGLEEVTSQEFPVDAAKRIEQVGEALKLLNGSSLAPTAGLSLVSSMVGAPTSLIGNTAANDATIPASSHITSVAEDAINAALGLPTGTTTANPSLPSSNQLAACAPDVSKATKNIIVRNMFDKDTETEDGWEEEIKLEFEEEAGKYGNILTVKVLSQEVGGKIYASFGTVEAAKACAKEMAGRWFDKRQLQVEYVDDNKIP